MLLLLQLSLRFNPFSPDDLVVCVERFCNERQARKREAAGYYCRAGGRKCNASGGFLVQRKQPQQQQQTDGRRQAGKRQGRRILGIRDTDCEFLSLCLNSSLSSLSSDCRWENIMRCLSPFYFCFLFFFFFTFSLMQQRS